MTTRIPISNVSILGQRRGIGNPYAQFPLRSKVAAITGGGRQVESRWAAETYIGSSPTGNPERWTTTLTVEREVTNIVQQIIDSGCQFGIGLVYGCFPVDWSNFVAADLLIDNTITSVGASGDIADRTTTSDPDIMDTLQISAGVKIRVRPLAGAGISGAVSTGAFNHVIHIGVKRCQGNNCGNDTFGQEFVAVGDPQSPATIPRIFYTGDGGNSWTQQTIAAVANGAAEQVAVSGNRVIVGCSGTNGGVYTASLADVRLGSATFTLAIGITGGSAIRAVYAVPNTETVFAAGDAGILFVSNNGGYTFTAIVSGTAQNLVEITGNTLDNIFIGGGTAILRYKNNALALIPNAGATGNVTTLRVPPTRNELYVGYSSGQIWRSLSSYAPTMTFEQLSFDSPAAGARIEDIQFTGARGAVMAILQGNGSSQTRMGVDYSGGSAGASLVFVTSFTSPTNSVINSLAMADPNYGLMVGEPNGGAGFIGRIYA